MGSDVRVSTVAIAQGNLTIKVNETPHVSQPDAFLQGRHHRSRAAHHHSRSTTARATRWPCCIDGVSLQSLVDGLNALGVGPRDIISILQAIKAAGALQAEIQVIG